MKRLSWLSIGIAVLLTTVTTAGQERVGQDFDTAKPRIFKGKVVEMFVREEAPVLILMDVVTGMGELDRYVIVGNPPAVLTQAGWVLSPGPGGKPTPTVKAGDDLMVLVFPARPGATPRLADGVSAEMAELAQRSHAAYGTELTLSDGRKLLFGAR